MCNLNFDVLKIKMVITAPAKVKTSKCDCSLHFEVINSLILENNPV